MENIKSADIVYFSGTGCTARIADALADALKNYSVTANKYEINDNLGTKHKSNALILLFPVYSANAPAAVDDWVSALPYADGKRAAVILVSGGGEMFFNTASRVSVIKRLEEKKYDVFYEEMFVMPANCIIAYDDLLCAMLLRAIPKKAEKAAAEIMTGAPHRKKPYLIDRLISKVMVMEKRMSKSFGKRLNATNDCISCGECASNCPRNNIAMHEGKPVFDGRCAMCLKCVYACPAKAIRAKSGKWFILKDGFDLNKIEERTKHICDFPPAGDIAKGFLFKGVRKYLNDN